MQRWYRVAGASFVLGCASTSSGDPFDDAGASDGVATSGSSAADADAASAEAGGSSAATTGMDPSDGGGPLLDVGAPETDGVVGCTDPDGPCEGCSAVDVLFVIDNSGSMCTYQDGLVEAFPNFVDAMYAALPSGVDLHVGITTSGFALGGGHSEVNCVPAEPLETIDEYYVRPTEGLVNTNGLQGRLLEHEGQNYYAVNTAEAGSQAALSEWFSGAATSVGCGVSSFEFNASGAAWALHAENATHNEGFLRDEGAVLVLFILSDEADQSLEVESLAFLHDTVTAAKAGCGGDECIVTGGLLSTWCIPDLNAGYDFLASFGDTPVWGDIAGGSIINPDTSGYSEVVGDAFAQAVAQTCESITPVG